MYETDHKKTAFIEQIINFVPRAVSRKGDILQKSAMLFMSYGESDLVIEPELLDTIRVRMKTVAKMMAPENIRSEDQELKTEVAAADLLLLVEKETNNFFEYTKSTKIKKVDLLEFDVNKLPRIDDLGKLELNFCGYSDKKDYPGTYPKGVNIKLYKYHKDSEVPFLRIRSFFKKNFFEQPHLSDNFKEKFLQNFPEENLKIRKHVHSDDHSIEFSTRIPLKSQNDLAQKTIFVINYIRNNPQKKKKVIYL